MDCQQLNPLNDWVASYYASRAPAGSASAAK
jgi:hypothetical protein